jgi:hypothetical protein
MIDKSYFYRKASDDEYFEYSNTRIELRQYTKNLIFYNPLDNQTAEYAIFDKTPYDLGEIELKDHGTFGGCITVKKPIKYSKKNLDTLQKTGTIVFNLAINKLDGYSKETIFLDKWPTNMPEDDYSFTITAGRESIKPCNFHLKENASKEDVLNTILVAVDPSIFKAEVDISDDISNIIIKSVYPGEIIEITDGTYGVNLLSVLDVGNKIFGCYPVVDQEIITFFNNEDNKFNIKVIHANVKEVSYLKILFYNENGELKTELKSKWENDGSSLTNVEINFDYDVAYLFLDGELKDFKSTGFIREYGGELWIQGTEQYPYTFDEFFILSTLSHTASFNPRTVQLTKYTSTRPYIDFFWKGNDISLTSLNQLVVSSTPNIHFILYADNQAYYYLSGAWRQSDGTFDQSNDLGAFVAKVQEFDFNNQEIAIRAFFNSDGTSPAWIENIYFELDNTSIYGDEAESPAILVGEKEHKDDLIDVYNKTLIITTDKGATEIIFEGALTLETNDECQTMVGCNEFILDFDNEDILQQALDTIPITILNYDSLTITKNILISQTLKLNENIILNLGGFSMAGTNTDALIILQEGAKITGNGINLIKAGTYKWNNTAFIRQQEKKNVNSLQELLDTIADGDNAVIPVGTTITVGNTFEVPAEAIITVNGILTIPATATGICYGTIDIYGTLNNLAGDDWGWNYQSGAINSGEIIIHQNANVYLKDNIYFIGNQTAKVTITSGTLNLTYLINTLNGEAYINSAIAIQDPYVVASGGILTVRTGVSIILVPQADAGPKHFGGSLTGNVVTE